MQTINILTKCQCQCQWPEQEDGGDCGELAVASVFDERWNGGGEYYCDDHLAVYLDLNTNIPINLSKQGLAISKTWREQWELPDRVMP